MELIVFLTTRSVCLVSITVIFFTGLEIEMPASFADSFKAIYFKSAKEINKLKLKVAAMLSKIISPGAVTLFLKRKWNKIDLTGRLYNLIKEPPEKTFDAFDGGS